MPLLLWVLLLWLAANPVAAAQASDSSEPRLAPLYALAVAQLLGESRKHEFVLLPSSAGPELTLRVRRGAGEARGATLTTAQEVVELLTRQGHRGLHGVRPKLSRSPFLQLVLGELRFEPPRDPTFARLVIGVFGTGDKYEVMQFLLRREAAEWRVISTRLRVSMRGESESVGARAQQPQRADHFEHTPIRIRKGTALY
jgi:hypothetical protein